MVKWDGYPGQDSWVRVKENKKTLGRFLTQNRANPHTSSLAAKIQCAAREEFAVEDGELLNLQLAVFDKIGQPKATPDASEGYEHSATVCIPFGASAFEKHFRGLPGMPSLGNVSGVDIEPEHVSAHNF